jgi:hypothetical protein
MQKSLPLFAAALFGAAALAQPASAQDLTTQTFGGTTIWVGGGVQFLTLPDIEFTFKDGRRQTNFEGDWLDAGPAAGGGIETALGYWGNARVTGAIKGFYANVEVDDRVSCGNDCLVINPVLPGDDWNGDFLTTRADRDVDYWGGQVEFKFARAEPVHERPDLYRNDYFIVGADIRGLDQDNRLRGNDEGDDPIFVYNETLDTTYYGAYVGTGGEYTMPIIGGIGDGWGLRTFVSARAGLYSAETDYRGDFEGERLSRSNDELAFIGSISFETRKPIGPRSSLSLWTDYEFISSVPEMHYADGDRPTHIDDDSLFASRTMLRFTIGLGSDQLYPRPTAREPVTRGQY